MEVYLWVVKNVVKDRIMLKSSFRLLSLEKKPMMLEVCKKSSLCCYFKNCFNPSRFTLTIKKVSNILNGSA